MSKTIRLPYSFTPESLRDVRSALLTVEGDTPKIAANEPFRRRLREFLLGIEETLVKNGEKLR